jgi:hypothetical protein
MKTKNLKSVILYPVLKVNSILIMLISVVLIIWKIDYLKLAFVEVNEINSLNNLPVFPLFFSFLLAIGAFVPAGIIWARKIKHAKKYLKTFMKNYVLLSFLAAIIIFLSSILIYFIIGGYFISILIVGLWQGQIFAVLIAAFGAWMSECI